MIEQLYSGKLENEIWKPVKYFPNYKVSNYGRVIAIKTNKILNPTKIKNQFRYRFYNKGKHGAMNVRPLLFKHFGKKQIKYDYGIPPRRILVNRIRTGKIGVYQSPTLLGGNKRWRYVIQYNNKHYAAYFHTKKGAESAWIAKYCELYKMDYMEVMKEIS